MTIYDIAKLAGVSKSTVSRVLNQDQSVSEKSRLKVEKVIREVGYTPNRNAANTKKDKQEVVLVLATRLDSYSETRLIRGMMEEAKSNVEFLITETQFDMEKSKTLIENNKNVSAIIIFAISEMNYSFVEELLIPVVLVGQKIKGAKRNVYFPDYESMEKLIQKANDNAMNMGKFWDEVNGKSSIFLGYDEHDKTLVARYEAANSCFNTNLEKVGLDEYNKLQDISMYDLGTYDKFICATDYIALTVYKELLKQGIGQFEILSVGNNRKINFIIDNLTTIDYHYKECGRYIVQNLKNKEGFVYTPQYSIVNN